MDVDFNHIECKSFNRDHEKNIGHVHNFDINITNLSRIDELADGVLRQNKYITGE
jgi:hypothetical protein